MDCSSTIVFKVFATDPRLNCVSLHFKYVFLKLSDPMLGDSSVPTVATSNSSPNSCDFAMISKAPLESLPSTTSPIINVFI